MDFSSLTVKELKEKCDAFDVPKNGKKAELVSRLIQSAKKSKPPKGKGRSRSATPKKAASPKKASTPKKTSTPKKEKAGTPKKSSTKKSTSLRSKSPTAARSSARSARSTSRTPSRTPSAASIKKKTKKASGEKVKIKADPEYSWLYENPPTRKGGVLTEQGAENIAIHKYVAGGNTSFDNWMNPFWNKWVEVLPMWMAPNLVTTSGGMFCLTSFLLTWYYNPLFTPNATPYWVLIVNGFCTWAYYTLDCMDGKQARRTGTSSPLGQLFDHGCDCVCNIAHISSVMAVLNLGPTTIAVAGQVVLQFSFFTAQWQEYHTHELPHKFGELGVTEVNHGTALFSLVFGVLQGLGVVDPSELFNSPSPVGGLKMNELFIWGWIAMNAVLLTISLKKTVSAAGIISLGHLLSPFLAALSSMFLVISSPTVLTSNLRLVILSVGFLFSHITNKMIVFSMAQMTFATLQPDILPLALVAWSMQFQSPEDGERTLLVLCMWQGGRMVYWSKKTIGQLCEKLDINCFTIKQKGE
ncbi:hypothetical protein TrCOL_g11401 [Triparma columacea]|uniref:SAP domain-containing protein n=1 Tax=Triparma columacea TaxID=722753 RepID=A0A9W7L1Q2_9STRA|nr:hypothetical protein TrCOL_g11401 [Triparma columacea]